MQLNGAWTRLPASGVSKNALAARNPFLIDAAQRMKGDFRVSEHRKDYLRIENRRCHLGQNLPELFQVSFGPICS